ncbi:carbohydrate ABC transporter permease [Paenibacillus alkalitolerans]|uniref:carbohydrate ABC transporter permease n=1 Tax=Paenibacillus alkalitolerans TaxID=2799335 RepID=UPI0018F41362|nr:sugar ABC transporter permease [Paenibacillus alkalitolerans]
MEAILKNRLNSGRLTFVLLTLPAAVLYAIFFVYPVVSGFFYSFTDWDGISGAYRFIGLDNYIHILQDHRFLHALGFTLYYTGLSVVLLAVVSLGAALLLNGNIRFKAFIRSVYFFPAVLSLVTVGSIFNQFFYAALPSIGEFLGIGWLSQNILSNPHTAIYGIVAANLWQGFAVPMVIFMAGLSGVPKDMHEAATIDGAGPFQRFFYVTIPFLIPMLIVNLVILTKHGLMVFDLIVLMTDGGPVQSTESIGILIYKHGFQNLKFGYGTAESIFTFFIMAVVSIVQIRILNRKGVGQQ